MNWKFWKLRPKIHITYTWEDEQGKTRRLKTFNEFTPEEQEALRLSAIRQALHRAVDMGLFDDNVREINEEKTDR